VEDADESCVSRLAKRLQQVVSEEIEVDGQGFTIELSVGVAIYPADGTDLITLLANADAALYRAKAEGRGAVRFFEAEIDRHLLDQRVLQHQLEEAIRDEQFVLHYQPQARIDGGLVGFEALVRWNHPERGLLPPADFIPLAEASGRISEIGAWVLRAACREAATWPSGLAIAVNLSPAQIQRSDFVGLVHTVLLETGLAPWRLELEVTEGVLVADFEGAVALFRRLKALGVRIVMDDLGSGHSSLAYLQSFPFDKIKIDKAFVMNLDNGSQSRAIIRAVLALGRSLGLPTLAEGVETETQQTFLRAEQCDQIQGFFIGKPQPISAYAALVSQASTLGGGSGLRRSA
jgi:predicted signal transduction protein with EAL and GGDEF domain